MKKIYILILFINLSCYNTNSYDDILKNKVFILNKYNIYKMDSFMMANFSTNENATAINGCNYIFKFSGDSNLLPIGTNNDGENQQPFTFTKYKIVKDSLFLELIDKSNNEVSMIGPFNVKKINEYDLLLSKYKKGGLYKIKLTDVTNFYSGKISNNSKLYNQFKSFVWYPKNTYIEGKNGEKEFPISWAFGYQDSVLKYKPALFLYKNFNFSINNSLDLLYPIKDNYSLFFSDSLMYIMSVKNQSIKSFKVVFFGDKMIVSNTMKSDNRDTFQRIDPKILKEY